MKGLSAAVLAAGWLLTGCAALTTTEETAPHGVSGAVIDEPFAVHGRFSARREQEAFAARFDWTHTPSTDALDFMSPMGATVARLARRQGVITLYQGEDAFPQQEVQGWEALTQRAFGMSLPVAALTYWIRGLPAPDADAHVTADGAGRIDNLRQHGWTVQFSYADARAIRPDRFDARYGETLELRVKIDGWALLPDKLPDMPSGP